jgi:putative transposase
MSKEGHMPIGKRRTVAQIQHVLREAEHDLAKGLTISDICRKLGVSQNTFYRWRQKYTSHDDDDTRRVRELSLEVDRLKKLVAELMLDKQMLQEVAKKKW